MRDHNFIDEQGRRTPISALPTALIQELISEGIEIVDDSDAPTCGVPEAMERLRLELEIRAMEGRL